MIKYTIAFAASSLLFALPATAQTQGGTSGGVQGRDVSASTYGEGTKDGSSIGVNGGGNATAERGTAETVSKARLNERRAMTRSVATARTDDERARSRTRTVVRNDGEIRSRTSSRYKERGSAPVRETTRSVTSPDSTVTQGGKGRRDD